MAETKGKRQTQPFSRCPDCGKKGVQFRFAKVVPGEDGYGCRYCDFWFFTGSSDGLDGKARARWQEVNGLDEIGLPRTDIGAEARRGGGS